MNSKITDKIINTTKQHLADGTAVSLTFQYPASFKIGDTIEVMGSKQDLQLFEPQHQEACFAFEIEIWDDRVRLQCDSIKELENEQQEGPVFSFRIREIELFATAFPLVQKVAAYN